MITIGDLEIECDGIECIESTFHKTITVRMRGAQLTEGAIESIRVAAMGGRDYPREITLHTPKGALCFRVGEWPEN